MDFKGQWLSEIMYYVIVILFGVVAWVVGYLQQDFALTVKGWAAGLALALLLCVPDWPYFNRNPVRWLEELPERKERSSKDDTTEGDEVKPKKSKRSH